MLAMKYASAEQGEFFLNLIREANDNKPFIMEDLIKIPGSFEGPTKELIDVAFPEL